MSKLFVDEIQPKTTGGAVGITGHVLNVKQAVQDTAFTIGTTETDIMSVQITPKSTASDILVTINLNAAHADSYSGLARLYRDSTVIGGGTGSNGANGLVGNLFTMRNSSSNNILNYSMSYLDSPSSTSAITYTLKGKSAGTTLYINRTIANTNYEYDSTVMSTITVTEIGG